jgi:hypothetical protein
MKPTRRPTWPALALAMLLASPLGSALAEGQQSSVEARYQRDRQACMANVGASAESRQACLREAGAVRQAAQRGTMASDVSADELQRNALARCEVHQDPVDRAACQRMTAGEGASQGSVESGGILRETITVMPPPPPVTPEAPPPTQ